MLPSRGDTGQRIQRTAAVVHFYPPMSRPTLTALAVLSSTLLFASCLLNRSGELPTESTSSSGTNAGSGGSVSSSSVGTAATGSGGSGRAASSSSGGAGGSGMGGLGGFGGSGVGGMGGLGGAGGMPPLCDAMNPNLLACYDFEGDTLDKVGNFDFIGSNPMFFTPAGVSAFDVIPSGDHIANGPGMAVQQLTIEMCFYANALPAAGKSMRLYRREGWAQMHVTAVRGAPRVGISLGDGSIYFNPGEILANTWYHAAVVFHDPQDTVVVHVRGYQPMSFADALDEAHIPAVPGVDTTLGYPGFLGAGKFDGYIDNLRVFNAARSNIEIKAAAKNCPL